uniref:Uncharacterized protein n=1 Tax=Arundo donax TaxID=35708 RepID=A0A0A9DF59_ARUDO
MEERISVGSINQETCRSCRWRQKCSTSIQKTLQDGSDPDLAWTKAKC